VDPAALPETLGGPRRIPRAAVLALKPPGHLEISPAFFGINYWSRPFGTLTRRELKPLNFVVIRGGFHDVREEHFDWGTLDRFVMDARALNLEPLIQVPYVLGNPAFAARMVRYVNIEKKYDVRFWSIGNEEDKNRRPEAKERWMNSWSRYRNAMKEADPRILIFGPEYASAYDFNYPENDWLTPFLEKNGDLVDVISLHRYPFNGGQTNPTVLIGDSLGTTRRVRALREHVKSVTGRDIPLAFTEMNLSDNWREGGEGSGESFSAGLWMAESLGQMAEAGVAMVNIWNARTNDSLGLIGVPAEDKRPTFYAVQMYSDYGDRIVPLASHVGNITAHAARNSRTGAVTIVLVNRSRNRIAFQLDFDSNQEPTQGSVYFDLSARKVLDFELPGHSMASLVLDSNLRVTRRFLYSREMYDNQQPPIDTP
jgi:hypothetical protein